MKTVKSKGMYENKMKVLTHKPLNEKGSRTRYIKPVSFTGLDSCSVR